MPFKKCEPGAVAGRWSEVPSYSAVHQWLRKEFPKTGRCEKCGAAPPPARDGRSRTHWAYQGEPGGWARDREMYLELCIPCHHEKVAA